MTFDLTPLILTFKLAFVTTVILAVIGIPLAYWLAFRQRTWKFLIEPLVSLPLVLPPTVLGFYILLLFSPQYSLGNFLETHFDIRIVFTFIGLVIGSVIFSLPFMVNPLKAGFESIPRVLIDASETLGKSRRETLWKIILPSVKPALLTGIIMSFAHTIGEFGVVLMIGGNIPDKTRVASIAIFNEVEGLNYSNAHVYSFIIIVISFILLSGLYAVNRTSKGRLF
jgi:molybdate transport system permease protein